jgi:two-component system heavy metal sensor histidine kinase CusS
LKEELSEYVDAAADGRWIEVRDPRGEIVIGDDLARGGKPYRMYGTEPVIEGQRYDIPVAAPLEETELTLRRLAEVLLWATPGVLLIASLGGYWISWKALQPVDAITRAAQTIGIENLSQRLDVPAAGDELARLSETWNAMLERLEAAVKRLSQFTADTSHELHAHRIDSRDG